MRFRFVKSATSPTIETGALITDFLLLDRTSTARYLPLRTLSDHNGHHVRILPVIPSCLFICTIHFS